MPHDQPSPERERLCLNEELIQAVELYKALPAWMRHAFARERLARAATPPAQPPVEWLEVNEKTGGEPRVVMGPPPAATVPTCELPLRQVIYAEANRNGCIVKDGEPYLLIRASALSPFMPWTDADKPPAQPKD